MDFVSAKIILLIVWTNNLQRPKRKISTIIPSFQCFHILLLKENVYQPNTQYVYLAIWRIEKKVSVVVAYLYWNINHTHRPVIYWNVLYHMMSVRRINLSIILSPYHISLYSSDTDIVDSQLVSFFDSLYQSNNQKKTNILSNITLFCCTI
jgi:hypothetical protein